MCLCCTQYEFSCWSLLDETLSGLLVHPSPIGTPSVLQKASRVSALSLCLFGSSSSPTVTGGSFHLSPLCNNSDQIFKIEREGESQRYKPFKQLHNRRLLWHGSRTTNFAGILSQGLRIAPPEAPVVCAWPGSHSRRGVDSAHLCSHLHLSPVGTCVGSLCVPL